MVKRTAPEYMGEVLLKDSVPFIGLGFGHVSVSCLVFVTTNDSRLTIRNLNLNLFTEIGYGLSKNKKFKRLLLYFTQGAEGLSNQLH